MGKREDDIADKFDVRNWPHQFTKLGNAKVIGEQDHDPIFAQPMVCIWCKQEYIAGQTNRPPDPCPARTKKTELKRLLS